MGNRWYIRFTLFSAMITGYFLLAGYAQATPTLVVDVDNGNMAIHVGNIGSLPKPVLAQSGGDGGTTLTAGDWGPISSFQIASLSGSLNGDGGPSPNVLSVIVGNDTLSYAEGFLTGGPTSFTFTEPMVFPLTPTYNIIVDARDLDFISLNGLDGTDWNTLYIGTVPEPSGLVLVALGVLGLTTRRRRR